MNSKNMNMNNKTINMNNNKTIYNNLANFDITLLSDFHYFIKNNPGKTTQYYIESYKKHDFTSSSFEFLLNQINTNRNTYHDIGPFVCKQGKWYCKSKNKKDFIGIINHQQKEIERLKKILYENKGEV